MINNNLKKEFVRLPCASCKMILPCFTIDSPTDSNYKIIKDLKCRYCKKIIRITITPSTFIKTNKTTDLSHCVIYTPNNYECINLPSLDWVKYDPSDDLTI